MMFCYYTFEASQHPKFYNEALKVLMKAKNKVFCDDMDVECLAANVRNVLDKNKPGSSPAKVEVNNGAEDIRITVSSGKDETDIGRAWFSKVQGFVVYDLDTMDLRSVQLKWRRQNETTVHI